MEELAKLLIAQVPALQLVPAALVYVAVAFACAGAMLLIFVAPLVFITLFNRVLPVFEPAEELKADSGKVPSA